MAGCRSRSPTRGLPSAPFPQDVPKREGARASHSGRLTDGREKQRSPAPTHGTPLRLARMRSLIGGASAWFEWWRAADARRHGGSGISVPPVPAAAASERRGDGLRGLRQRAGTGSARVALPDGCVRGSERSPAQRGRRAVLWRPAPCEARGCRAAAAAL